MEFVVSLSTFALHAVPVPSLSIFNDRSVFSRS
jgi:hypothetical protein